MPSKVYCSTLAFVPTVGILSSFSFLEQPKKEAASAKARSRGITFHPFFFIKMTILLFTLQYPSGSSIEQNAETALYPVHIRALLFIFLNHQFCRFINIPTAKRDDQIAFLCVINHVLRNLVEGVEPDAAGDLFG